MPSNIQGMIQTIVSLRQLQLQEEAQRLQQQQLGISQQNAQQGATAGFQNLLQGVANPGALAPFAGNFAQTTGLPTAAINTLIQQTPPSTTTTKARAVESGARQLGGSQDVTAASGELTGMSSGQAAADKLRAVILGQAGDMYSRLPADQQGQFQQSMLTGLTSGQDVGSAAISSAIANLSPEEKRQAARIGKGLAPSASDEAQLHLGYRKFLLDQHSTEMNLAFEDLRTKAALSAVDVSKQGKVSELLEKRDALLQFLTSKAPTITTVGRDAFIQNYNNYNEQIRQMAPQVYGPQGVAPLFDLPKGTDTGTTNAFSATLPYLSGQR
jgi:hypothetical protein